VVEIDHGVHRLSVGRWTSTPRDALDWRVWDDEVVLYDAASAATHLLQWPAGPMFTALQQRGTPLSTAELLELALGSGEAPPSNAELESGEATLAGLERMGLIARLQP
jgi:PqqD family protein of HPr-rel-A system